MRFYIGFSKRISIKTIIEILGFIFVALLTFFGIYDTTHALTQVSGGSFTTFKYEDLTYNSSGTAFDTIVSRTGNVILGNPSYGYSITSRPINYGNTEYGYFINASSSFDSNVRNTMSLSYKLDNSTNKLCYQDSTDIESVDFYFYLRLTDYGTSNSLSTFHVDSFADTFEVRIDAVSIRDELHENRDLHFTTTCSKTLVNQQNFGDSYYLITCNNVMRSNHKYQIDYYNIDILNGIPFNNRFLQSNTMNYINVSYVIGRMSEYISPYDKSFMYDCNNDMPVLDGGFPADDDPGGLNDIYNSIKGNYNVDIPGIDTTMLYLDLPVTFTDLLMLPFDVVKAVVNNADTCNTYDIDFTSIMVKWGSPDSSYVLHLPCMREVLSNKLGNWYTIFDMLLCFVVFYDITMHCINLISAITSGEDLFGYFFQKSGSNNSKTKYVDNRTGEVVG